MSLDPVEIEVQEEVIEIVEIVVDENSAASAIAAAQAAQNVLAQVQTYLTLLNQANTFVQLGDITRSGNNITFVPVWKWLILSTPYQLNSGLTLTVPYSAEGKTRIDLLLATTSNTFIRYAGTEVTLPVAPVAPTPPINTLVAGFVIVTDATVGDVVLLTTPVYLSFFSSKLDFDNMIPRVPVGSYAYIKNSTQNVLCQYTASGWTFLELNTYKKFVEWSNGNSRTIELDLGVQPKNVFVNDKPIYSVTDSATYGKWSQSIADGIFSITISEDELFEDQTRILITN